MSRTSYTHTLKISTYKHFPRYRGIPYTYYLLTFTLTLTFTFPLTYPLTFPDPLLARQRLTTQSRMNAYEFVSQSSCQWHSLIALATQSVALQKLQ